MLDSDTKSRIDSARDILVGKVPDPKSQVEQITIALIYKFMDDMDRQSEELGGKATFFSQDYKKYSWPILLDPRLGGHERLLLYAEGIEKMNQNKNIPQLFRDIFKGAFLPYRDPETLNLFLKEINGFIYDHSERLGDAFEYLLSVLGSQGEAGQFRTPRHIIDFIVKIVDPKKDETVLDPACGTAGFLISSFKHIMAANTKERPGDMLSADERGRLMTNFNGYDISPDMVRLSRVNLYLHGFAQPRIYEYDTLTSEERWDERCDVILANPPFMSPKGGIRPHNRFSIKANRSEVLFVDYIAEHLNTGGRAGVIVPEGIIFQSQNAYKALRKMLIENYLWAVVSLPGGCFNPYSGVKTSILFLDKSLAKRTDEILFMKIEGDGFGLGAQRRPNGKDDLPEALRDISDFKLRISNLKKSTSANHQSTIRNPQSVAALAIKKSRILESTDINLSGDRYRDNGIRASGKWPIVKLGDLCSLEYGSSLPERNRVAGPFPVVGSNGIAGFHNKFTVQGPAIIVGRKGSAGEVTWIESNCTPIDTTYFIKIKQENVLLLYLFYILQNLHLTELRGGAGVPGLNRNDVYCLEIPLPPLEEQERIVSELDGYQKVIEGARQVIANYKPTIKIDPMWPMVKLGEVCEIKAGGTPSRSEKSFWNGDIPWVGSTVCKDDEVTTVEEYITQEGLKNSAAKLLSIGTTLIALVGATIGKTGLLKFDSTTNQNIAGLYPKSIEILEPTYLFHATQMLYPIFLKLGEGKFRMANLSFIRDQEIPIPPLPVQHQIVAELESERVLVESNRKLVEIFEKKIQSKLAEIWGEIEVANERV